MSRDLKKDLAEAIRYADLASWKINASGRVITRDSHVLYNGEINEKSLKCFCDHNRLSFSTGVRLLLLVILNKSSIWVQHPIHGREAVDILCVHFLSLYKVKVSLVCAGSILEIKDGQLLHLEC